MDREKLKDTFDNVKPTHEQKERMLKNILGSLEEKDQKDSNEKIIHIKTKKRKNLNKGLAIAACFGLFVIMGRSIYQNVERDDIVNEPPILEPEPVQDDIGMRKFLNFQGYRYVFIQGGKQFDLENRVEKELGILKYHLDYKGENPSISELQRDNSTTFGVGGKILKLKDTDTFFRIGVNVAGDYYICENVGPVDDSPMNIEEFFEKSKLEDITEEIIIMKQGQKVREVEENKKREIIEVISRASSVELDNYHYEKIGVAYNEGNVLEIILRLDDGTEFNMRYIKSLGLITIGDSYYSVQDLQF